MDYNTFVSKLNIEIFLLCIFTAAYFPAIESREVIVNCSEHTEEHQCYVNSPVNLVEGDSLKFENVEGKQSKVLQFNITWDAQIPFIPISIFQTFPYLEYLKLSTGIKAINHADFEYARNLYNLSLSDNRIEGIGNSVFSLAPNVVELLLDGNEILTVDNYAFNGLDKLFYLNLNKNRIITLKQYTFAGARYLSDLRLEYNQIETLEDGVFDLPNLLFLYLGHNSLKQLPDGIFSHTSLLGLDLQSNQLKHLGDAIYSLKHIVKLDLTNNSVDDLDLRRFANMTDLVDLSLDRNGLQKYGVKFNGTGLKLYRDMLNSDSKVENDNSI